jgi:hypothetical protein
VRYFQQVDTVKLIQEVSTHMQRSLTRVRKVHNRNIAIEATYDSRPPA